MVESLQNTKFVPSSDSEDDVPDFDYLLKLPAGSHFLLKSEQEKFNQQPDQIATFSSKHFSLDANILNLAIQTIPFNERHENFKMIWNSQELRQMKEEASLFEEKYIRNLVKARDELPLNIDQNDESPIKPASNIENSVSSSACSSNPKEGDKESIQKWLDDILEI